MSREKSNLTQLDNIPTDTTLLRELVGDLFNKLEASNSTIEQLKNELILLRYRQYGRKSERFNFPGQADLFGDILPDNSATESPEIAEIPAKNVDIPKKSKKIRSHGRNPLPDNLPVEIVEIQPAPEDLICQPCGSEKQQIGEVIREELDYKPGSIFVRKFVRGIYACPQKCEGQVTVAENVSGPIEKGLPGAGLLAHVVTSKYADHLPLNRQENILARHGVSIPRTTLCDWTAAAAHNLRSFRDLIRDEVLKSYVIHTDDTPVDVNDPKGKNKPHKGRIWIYHGDRNHPYILYDFSPNRSSEWPKQLLSGWQGILQADAFTGYDKIFTAGQIREAACWAHARRKFVEAEKTQAKESIIALEWISQLYHIESAITEALTSEGLSLYAPGDRGAQAAQFRYNRRQEASLPLLKSFEQWLRDIRLKILPKSPLGTALNYALSNWSALTLYASEGEVSIDNNTAERGIRPITVGRKNYLFFGSDKGGETAAILYSVIMSAKRHGLAPWEYLQNVFSRIPMMKASELPELLPDRWKIS